MKVKSFLLAIAFLFFGLGALAFSEKLENYDGGESVVSFKPRLADRYYIKSVLLEVFGKQADAIIEKHIFQQGQIFGGACDEYEQIRIGPNQSDLRFKDALCPNGNVGSRITLTPNESVLRLGHLYKACEQLVNNKIALKFAVKQISRSNEPQYQDYQSIKLLFNATAEDQASEQLAKKIFAGEAFRKLNAIQKWKLLFKLNCQNTDWQLL